MSSDKMAASLMELIRERSNKASTAQPKDVMEMLLQAMGGSDDKAMSVGLENVAKSREVKKIVIPEGMPFDEAARIMQAKHEEQENVVDSHSFVPCFPLDGAYALNRALNETFGAAELKPAYGDPPPVVQIKTGPRDEDAVSMPFGRMTFPGMDAKKEYIEVGIAYQSGFPGINIVARIKRKTESLIRDVVSLTTKYLKTHSIYRGRIIKLDLEWLEALKQGMRVNIFANQPTFIRETNVSLDDLVLNDGTSVDISMVARRITDPTHFTSRRVRVGGGFLFAGPYGVGKSFAATVLSNLAARNNWLFMFLQNPNHLGTALDLARLYDNEDGGVVIFVEDIDGVGSDRNSRLNHILEQMDGIVSKDSKRIITVMTTNHPERLSPAFKRAGRITKIVHFELPNAESTWRLVQKYSDGKVGLRPTYQDAVETMTGWLPAFIQAATEYARLMQRNDDDIISPDDLNMAALSHKREHDNVIREYELEGGISLEKAYETFYDKIRDLFDAVA